MEGRGRKVGKGRAQLLQSVCMHVTQNPLMCILLYLMIIIIKIIKIRELVSCAHVTDCVRSNWKQETKQLVVAVVPKPQTQTSSSKENYPREVTGLYTHWSPGKQKTTVDEGSSRYRNCVCSGVSERLRLQHLIALQPASSSHSQLCFLRLEGLKAERKLLHF